MKVGIVGYGVIGRRAADAVEAQPDMELAGVLKHTRNYGVGLAGERGHRLFSTDGSFGEGSIEDLLAEVDVVVDSTPGGVGMRNKEEYYLPGSVPAVFQGGEAPEVGVSFNALANYEDALNRKYVRVVSCNTTALARLLYILDDGWGVEDAYVVLIRRAADPNEDRKGPVNAILPGNGLSHHARDLQEVLPVPVRTKAYKVPTTLMHMQDISLRLYGQPGREELVDALLREPRILVVPSSEGLNSTARLRDYARELRFRGDIYENVVYDSIDLDGRVYITQAVHQEAIVVPEIIDALRAMQGIRKEESLELTNRTLGVGALRAYTR